MSLYTDKASKYVPRLMTDLGITRVQACGIFGNIGGETGGFAALQEKRPVIAGSRGGYGWLQWTGPRRKKYEAWAKSKRLDPAADETNYQYLVFETKTDEAKSLTQLKKTTTLEAATETFMKLNLRPGAPHLEGRISWAKKAWEASASPSGAGAVITGGAVVAGGAVVTSTQVAPGYDWTWFIIAGCVAAVAVGAALLIHFVNRKKENEIKEIVSEPKKAKANRSKAKRRGTKK